MLKMESFLGNFSMKCLFINKKMSIVNYNGSIINYQGKISKRFATYAYGGIITYDGNYRIHTFTTNGSLNVIRSGIAQILIVGGGGNPTGMEGGGGGQVIQSQIMLDEIHYSIIVGTSGTKSSFYGIDASPGIGSKSGSGNIAGGTVQVYGGVDEHGQNYYFTYGGGGGGDSSKGYNAISLGPGNPGAGIPGNGGDGTKSSISGTLIGYGGGGGGGDYNGGYGKGGAGKDGGAEGAGFHGDGGGPIANSGGGGGGNSHWYGPTNGASGIVIIRYFYK